LDKKYLAPKMKPEQNEPIKMVNDKPDWATMFKTKCTMEPTSDGEYPGDKDT
jgi:hypothetical protein